MLILSYMDSFVQLPVVKNSNDVINLRKLYDKIEISYRNLDSLDVKKETYGNLLISIINARLPEELRLYLSRKFKNTLWNIDDLLTFLKQMTNLITSSSFVVGFYSSTLLLVFQVSIKSWKGNFRFKS